MEWSSFFIEQRGNGGIYPPALLRPPEDGERTHHHRLSESAPSAPEAGSTRAAACRGRTPLWRNRSSFLSLLCRCSACRARSADLRIALCVREAAPHGRSRDPARHQQGQCEPGPVPPEKPRGGDLATGSGRPSEHFQADLNVSRIVTHFFENRLRPRLENGEHRLSTMLEMAKGLPAAPGDDDSAAVVRTRIEALEKWQRRGRSVVPMIIRWLRPEFSE